MSSSDIALSVRGLSKSYTIAHNAAQHSTAAEALMHRLRNPFHKPERETFWALNDVSFDIHRGDVVGVIGRNGAGKSTLLKILSRITEPTKGQIDLYGRVGSLLEVGTGFHAELTGRENIYLNGAILGMTRREIAQQFDAIVDFSGVEQFLDTPVKRYSSGMYVRLAFAVAAHLNPEIMIVDEVLAVGDAEFQKKCLGKMKDVANSGRTVLFVSHHMQSVSVLCGKAMYLDKGRVTYLGDVPGAVQRYMDSFGAETSTETGMLRSRSGTGEMRLASIKSVKSQFDCAEPKHITFAIQKMKPTVSKFFTTCHIYNEQGTLILHCDSRMVEYWRDVEDIYYGEFILHSPWLKPGRYRVEFLVCNAGIMDRVEHACTLNVSPLLPYPSAGNDEATQYGDVFADFQFSDKMNNDVHKPVTLMNHRERSGVCAVNAY